MRISYDALLQFIDKGTIRDNFVMFRVMLRDVQPIAVIDALEWLRSTIPASQADRREAYTVMISTLKWGYNLAMEVIDRFLDFEDSPTLQAQAPSTLCAELAHQGGSDSAENFDNLYANIWYSLVDEDDFLRLYERLIARSDSLTQRWLYEAILDLLQLALIVAAIHRFCDIGYWELSALDGYRAAEEVVTEELVSGLAELVSLYMLRPVFRDLRPEVVHSASQRSLLEIITEAYSYSDAQIRFITSNLLSGRYQTVWEDGEAGTEIVLDSYANEITRELVGLIRRIEEALPVNPATLRGRSRIS